MYLIPNYRETFFQHPTLTKIAGNRTYTSLAKLKRECKANAKSARSDLGGGSQGHLGLVSTSTGYARITLGTSFIWLSHTTLTITWRNGRSNQRRPPSLRWPNDCFERLQHHQTDHCPKNQHRTGQQCPSWPHQRLHRYLSWYNTRNHGQTIRYVRHRHATIAHRRQIKIRNNDLRPLLPNHQPIHRYQRLHQHWQNQWCHRDTSSADQHWPHRFNARFNLPQMTYEYNSPSPTPTIPGQLLRNTFAPSREPSNRSSLPSPQTLSATTNQPMPPPS